MLWYEIKADVKRANSEKIADIYSDHGIYGVAYYGAALFYDAKETRPLDMFVFEGEDFNGDPEDYLVSVVAYISEEQFESGTFFDIKKDVESLFANDEIFLNFREVSSEDWASSWKQYYKPERIGDNIIVVPMWEDYTANKDEIVVRLDPGEAFGTGQHGTTKAAVLGMCDIVKGSKVLDIGTGSGILSIIAAKLGATDVTALDIDPVAVKVAIDNVNKNDVSDKIAVSVGDLVSGVCGEYDVVVANILKDVIIALVPDLKKVMSQSAKFVCAGFITKHEDEVKKALINYGHRIVERYEVEDWVSFVSEVV